MREQIEAVGKDKEQGSSQLSYQIKSLKEENQTLQKKLLFVEDQNSDLKEKIAALEDEAEEKMQVNSQLQDKQKTISSLNDKIRNLTSKSEEQEREISGLKVLLRNANTELDSKDKIHANELEVKGNIIVKLQEQISKLNEDLSKFEESLNTQSSKGDRKIEGEKEYQIKMISMKEEYEKTISDLKSKLLEYKDRLKLEEQKQAQSNDFEFDDDELARIQIENEALLKRVQAAEEEAEEKSKDFDYAQEEYSKLRKVYDSSLQEVAELRKNVADLKSLYQKTEMANEQLKKSGGGGTNERMIAANLKHFEELERKYIQTKKYV